MIRSTGSSSTADIDNGSDSGDDGPHGCNGTTHMLRGTWFSNDHKIFYYGLPSPLLDYLRKARNTSLDANSPVSFLSLLA